MDNKEFIQCKFLLFTFDRTNIDDYKEIQSMDEAREILDGSMEYQGRSSFHINIMTEFWGHCSNLQVWAENDYDTRLLEKTIAFPLLQEFITRIGESFNSINLIGSNILQLR